MIVSFYSYKGGVGLTQLTANLAYYLCYYTDKRILLIDWDLEAPGLHYYLGIEKIQKKGIIELLNNYLDKIKNSVIQKKDLPNINDYITNVVKSKANSKIDLITCGYYDDSLTDYNIKINSFNWKEFYERFDGATYFELLKEQIKSLDYDFVFIDSRTGISDYSGIVNIQLPDMNVLIAAPTKQNIDGIFKVAKNINLSDYVKEGFRKSYIMPILSRVDVSIEKLPEIWTNLFNDYFSTFIKDFCKIINADETRYVNDTLLEYKRDISFGEQVLFNSEKKKIDRSSLAWQYQEIGNIFLKISNQLNSKIDGRQTIRVFFSFSHQDRELAEFFIDTFKIAAKVSGNYNWDFWSDRELSIGSNFQEEIEKEINKADIGMFLVSNNLLSSQNINEFEISNFIQKSQQGDSLIIPVLLSPSIIQGKLEFFQFFMPKGDLYGEPNIKYITFADLVQFRKTDGVPIPNPHMYRYIQDLYNEVITALKIQKPNLL